MAKFFFTCIILFTVLFTYTVVAQEGSFLRKPSNVTLPEKIQGPLGDPIPAGTYSIGTGGYFPTIDSAFNKLSIDGVAGNVTLELIDELYVAPATQFGFLLNGPIPGTGPTSRVTIKPAQNKNVTIEGNNESLLYLINTSYVTFDGVALTGPTTLTIHALQNSAYVFNDALDFINNSDHDIIQNIIFIVEDNTRASGSGFWFTQTGSAPDSNLIQNNFVKKAGDPFFIVSASAILKGKDNIIRGNQIGSETDSLISLGIDVAKCENALVENNIIQNLKVNMTGTERVLTGILSTMNTGTVIRNNVIRNLRAISGYSSSGIFLGSDGANYGDNNLVYNNMIYDIQSTSSQSNSRVTGIEVWYQNNPKIYYNSVYLSGTGSQHLGSAALYIGGYNSNVAAKDNILINIRDEGQYCASAIYDYSASNLTSDYNDLYYDDTNNNNCLVRIGSTKYNKLADWQSTGKDFHSASIMPCFSGSNLHIDATTATCLESRGTPIPGIDTDFDGEPRHTYLPDIGADEFDGLRPAGALTFGAYSVGTHGFFTSIEEVFDRLSSDGVDAAVTLELIDELYTAPTDSFGFKLNGPIPGAGPNSRVTIKPAENQNVVVEGAGYRIFSFYNTSYLTLDGVDISGSTTLTIHGDPLLNWLMGVTFAENSDYNIIQHLTIILEDKGYETDGIAVWGSATSDNNIIQNNFIKSADVGIIVAGKNQNTKATGNIISGNKIGLETDSLITIGIGTWALDNSIIENNVIQNLRQQQLIYWDIALNFGISLSFSSNSIVRGNVVHNMKANSLQGSTGIWVAGDAVNGYGNDNLVYNNMVYDIQSISTQSDSRVSGIQLWYQNNPKIYFNSVYLSGIGANKYGSAALYITSNVTNAEIKNNIFVNTRDESPYCASAIYDYTAGNLTSDYNDLYYDNTNSYNCLVKISGVKYNTLADWQATGKDLHSYTEMPHFMSQTDLHIDETIATYLESRGTPIAGIDKDFDGQTRHATTPDIGADEFNGIVVGVEEEETLPTEFALLQNYPNPFNPNTVIGYQLPVNSEVMLKVFDLLGNEIATLVDEYKPAGRYEVEFDSHSGNIRNLSSGVYFYQLKANNFLQTRKMLLIK